MPRRLGALLSIIATVSVAVTPLQGKQLARTAHRPARSQAISNAVTAILLNSDAPGDDLHRACARTNFKLLALGLAGVRAGLSQPKSEFETNAEYADRTQKLESVVNGPNPVIICQPLNDNDDAPFTYDADRQMFNGTFGAHQNVWRDVKGLGSYVSRTRMGIRARVKASADLEYDVDMSDSLGELARTCVKDETVNYSYEVPVSRSDAPRVKAYGYLVFMGRLVSPFIESDDTPGSPTLDDPNDVYERDLTVHFAPSQIALVGPDGKRLWECSPKTK